MRLTTLSLLLLPAAPAAAAGLAAEVRPADGPAVSGELTLGESGGFRFRPADMQRAPESVVAFRPTGQPKPHLRAAVPLRVRLLQQQVVTGEAVSADATRVNLRTAGAGVVAVPRAAVRHIAHPDGWQLVFADTFEAEAAGWKEAGKPRRADGDATSGKRALVLDGPNQRAVYEPKDSPAGGKVGINFRQSGRAKGRHWFVELDFVRDKGATATVAVRVGGPGDMLSVRSADKPEFRGEVRRADDWRRLTVEFSPSWLRVFVDDVVLWSQAEGPGGPLRACRLRCDGEAPGSGAMRFDDFAIHTAVARRRLTFHDPTQDAVITRDGDALFGNVVGIDSAAVRLDGKFGKRSVAWVEAAGVTFVRQNLPPATTEGEQVRLTLRGPHGVRDVLDGAVKAIDAKGIVLSHAFLGKLSVPVGAVEQIRPRFFGRELLIDSAPHHLGKKTRAEFTGPKPEGLSLTRRFRVDQLDGDATLVVEAAHLVGPADGKDIAESLRRGGLQTAVYVNEKRAGCLNDRVDRSSPRPEEVRLTISKDLLAAGENSVELRQTADPETGRVADVEIHSLRLELPRGR